MRRFTIILALTLAGFAGLLAAPVQACGCGGYIPREGSAQVTQERALLRWDGKTEDIIMSLGVLGQSKDAAVILPVPSRAELKLGDAKIFDELEELTKPLVEEQRVPERLSLGSGAAPGSGVTVLERKQLGPFDVSNLAASDTSALGEWLKANGYYASFSPALARALEPYAAQGWNFIAVRVQPGTPTDTLTGNLDPLWATFASDKLVYPMRASANAQNQQSVTLFVFSDHRVEKNKAFGSSDITFANWVEPVALTNSPTLKLLITRKWFLTKFEDRVIPSQVNDDFIFTTAASDTAYRATRIVQVPDMGITYLNLALTLCVSIGVPILLLGFIGLFLIWLVRRSSKQGAA